MIAKSHMKLNSLYRATARHVRKLLSARLEASCVKMSKWQKQSSTGFSGWTKTDEDQGKTQDITPEHGRNSASLIGRWKKKRTWRLAENFLQTGDSVFINMQCIPLHPGLKSVPPCPFQKEEAWEVCRMNVFPGHKCPQWMMEKGRYHSKGRTEIPNNSFL